MPGAFQSAPARAWNALALGATKLPSRFLTARKSSCSGAHSVLHVAIDPWMRCTYEATLRCPCRDADRQLTERASPRGLPLGLIFDR